LIRFILESYIFRKLLIATITLFVVVFLSNKLFDKIWGSPSTLALTDLNDVYSPPQEYDNIKKVNMSFVPPDKICIEGNLKLRLVNSSGDFRYFDTAKISLPTETFELRNKIFIQFADSKYPDSIYIVVSKSDKKDIYWRQIFLSSVVVKTLNETGKDTSGFRVDKSKLCPEPLLENNDTLINQTLNYFNLNKDTLTLGDCGINSSTFKRICKKFNLPCRVVGLQGGDEDEAGYLDQLGYPTHAICEVYASRFQKWYVIDPSFGFRFKLEGSQAFMNAVEISDKFFFLGEKDIIQDSIMFTKRNLVERDYFKYYENVIFLNGFNPNFFLKKAIQHLYAKYSYQGYLYANITPSIKNAKNYMVIKSLMYLAIIILYSNFMLFIMLKRLLESKKPHNHN
jgi:hypothetical protein